MNLEKNLSIYNKKADCYMIGYGPNSEVNKFLYLDRANWPKPLVLYSTSTYDNSVVSWV